MTRSILAKPVLVTALGVAVGCMLSGCYRMNASVIDSAAGLNGSFEIVKDSLPVNWLVYTPTTVPTGDYDLVVDTTEYHGGKQSLKFVVRQCSAEGGWRSPGFSRELDAVPGRSYTVGFWVKNDGAEFVAKVGGVKATTGTYETIVKSSDRATEWTYHERTYRVPAGFGKLRVEVNVLRPGTFWIDDVTISSD
jgi:hypothetical protein